MKNSDGLPAKPPIASLTGLRGIAALFVVINHYSVWCAAYDPATTNGYIAWLFDTSEVGMTLFFTLSGFVITYNYYDFGWGRTPIGSLLRFIYYRISRLYPALLVFLFGYVTLRGLSA
ncbi:MAG TPA: acyltransferase family protein, partial [Alphaproteobacteria bacterium]|nr:acyltransferase family protein [Alphaproteobacteria bacterium]